MTAVCLRFTIVAKKHASLRSGKRQSYLPAVRPIGAPFQRGRSMGDFGKLLEEQIPRLRRYARALTRNASVADDLIQECLMRAFTKQHLWQPGRRGRCAWPS
jgi:response regulator PhyR-like protein